MIKINIIYNFFKKIIKKTCIHVYYNFQNLLTLKLATCEGTNCLLYSVEQWNMIKHLNLVFLYLPKKSMIF